jgi:chromosome segregation ATPase
MEHNVHELKEALTARSHTATLEELQSRGKRQVRVIRADDVASMIEAAVADAIANSGLMSPQEVEDLVAKSRQQFQSMMERRQAEVAELRQAAQDLEACREELARVKREQLEVLADRQRVRGELDAAAERVQELERQLEAQAAKAAQFASAPVSAGLNADLVYRLMGEIAEARSAAPAPVAVAAAPTAAATDALTGALQELTNSFTAKLETLSRKMGVSPAVQSDAPNLAALFKHEDSTKLESNMDNLTVKAKSATGIAANLERLKKLKGGG